MVNVYVLNATYSGMELTKSLYKYIQIKGLIGLTNRNFNDSISGGFYCKDDCNIIGIDFIGIEDYSLKTEYDKNCLLSIKIDVLFVVSWQRLIPSWLIEHCGKVIGFHGSPWGITSGRGRSPQNWALILGEQDFYLSMFYITPAIDSGVVINTRKFCYSEFDDIKTSQYKVQLLCENMIISFMNDEFHDENIIQNNNDAYYLPQRIPEDGAIDWNCSVKKIYNFVRALTHPYPGAFSYYHDTKIKIWKVRPFNIELESKFKAGEVVRTFSVKDFLVGAKDGFLLVEDYEFENSSIIIESGMVFTSIAIKEQMGEIISRHKNKYPDLLIQDKILKFYIDD
jgi:UDP-4-amino-4-deoxy-L-arabinose formyltransferase/UDP-glucuronic acid dehydrogenase (UDP-4-keto-hexauronic acid decarboxylating)